MQSIIKILISLTIFLLIPSFVWADHISSGNNPSYYKMGSGQGTPVPAYNGASSIPLNVDGDVGLGYNCGLFNPQLSITNSLNAIKSSRINLALLV